MPPRLTVLLPFDTNCRVIQTYLRLGLMELMEGTVEGMGEGVTLGKCRRKACCVLFSPRASSVRRPAPGKPLLGLYLFAGSQAKAGIKSRCLYLVKRRSAFSWALPTGV